MENKKKNIDELDVKQEDLYSVPEGYFDSLEDQILASTVDSKDQSEDPSLSLTPKKVISIRSRRWIWSAAAAVVVGIGCFAYLQQDGASSVNNETFNVDYLAQVSETDILAYLEDEELNVDNEILDYAEYYGVDVEESSAIEVELSNEEIIDELSDIDLDDLDISDLDLDLEI